MNIFLVSGVGYGSTSLSAFDAALEVAGIHNFNLLKLSSVIPTNARVNVVPRLCPDPAEHGYLLYVVMAEARSEIQATSIAAGLGWYQLDDGRGVFAEHEDTSQTIAAHELEHRVADRLRNTVEDLCHRRGWPLEDRRLRFQTISCQTEDRPASALVAAIYESQPFSCLQAHGQRGPAQ